MSIDVLIATPVLPSWLADFVPSTDDPQSVSREPDKNNAKAKRNRRRVQFARRLPSHTDAGHIRKNIKALNIDLQQAPEVSSQAFERLLRDEISHERLIQFFEDPTLNVTAAHNLFKYVQHVKLHALSTSELASLRQYIKQAVALGLVSEDEIQLIIKDEIEHCVPPEPEGGLPVSNGVGFLRSIWDGLRQSSVFPVEGLDGRTLRLMINRLNQDDYENEHRSLAQSIVAAATQDQLVHMTKSISYSLLAWSQYRKEPEVNVQGLEHGWTTFPGLTDYIDSLPGNVARPALAYATRALLSRKQGSEADDAHSALLFQTWMRSLSRSAHFRSLVLGSAEWQAVERRFARPMYSNNITTYLGILSELDQCKFIIRTWTPPLAIPERGLAPADVCSAVMRSFDELCCMRGLTQCYNNLILALYQERQLSNRILTDTFSLLRLLSRSDFIIQAIELLHSRDIPSKSAILGAEVARYSQINVGVALRIFELHILLTLEGCMPLAIALINDPVSHIDTCFRLLTRYRPDTPDFPTPGRAIRTLLLNRMATAFAHANHIKPRTAFRKVYRCYIILRRGGLPVQPELVRALTHAGIVRYLQAGQSVGTQKIQWILSRVREAEGDEVEKVMGETIYHWRQEVVTRRVRPLEWNRNIRQILEKEVYAAAANELLDGREDGVVKSSFGFWQ